MSDHGHDEGLAKELKIILGILFLAVLYQFFPFSVFTPDSNGTNIIKIGTGLDNLDNPLGGYIVSRVIDGDTIEVTKNNQITTVRLIGVDTPESVGNNAKECFGNEATKYTESVAGGETVTVETDDSQDRYDMYGRLLAYVYMLDNQMLNRKLIADGFAYEYTYNSPYKYQDDFKTLESFAKREGRGLWSIETCNGKKQIN